MDISGNQQASREDEQHQTAVPYIPPPPPEISSQRKSRGPLTNGMIIACLILLVGFMAYNFVGHALTQTAGIYDEQLSPTPTISITPTVSPSPSQ